MAASTDGRGGSLDELGPFFPETRACEPLLERAVALVAEGHRLQAASGQLAAALRPLLLCMNACHAAELDGTAVHPADLEREPSQDPALEPELARAVRLARAHVAAEMALSAALPTKRVGLYAPEFVQCIHAELHRARCSDVRDLEEEPPPGAWRLSPEGSTPAPALIEDELELWQGIYSKPFGLEHAVVAACCAQHRLLRVRPFAHGNGRTARLHTLLVLGALGLTHGLWSPFRGMARDRDRFLGRRGDPREPEQLADFASGLLDVCLEQAQWARELLDTERLKCRLHDLLGWLGARPWTIGSEKSVIKPDALEALHYTALTGPVERARFIAMLGLQHRTGRRVLSSLLDCGLLVSESSRAPVRFNLPLPSLRFIFPGLWPDLGAPEPRGSATESEPEAGWSAGAPQAATQ